MSFGEGRQIWGVVPAAGMGQRMRGEIPKQYLEISGRPIIEISLEKLLAVEGLSGIVVALNENDTRWEQLSIANSAKIHTVAGGPTRSQSVLNALLHLSRLKECAEFSGDIWVCIHDAARPCVTPEKIQNLLKYCLDKRTGALLGVPVADTLKRVSENDLAGEDVTVNKTENRDSLWHAHTPQMFLLQELRSALDYCAQQRLEITDDASAIEHVGGKVDFVTDRRDNIKVTLPDDLALANLIVKQQIGGETQCV